MTQCSDEIYNSFFRNIIDISQSDLFPILHIYLFSYHLHIGLVCLRIDSTLNLLNLNSSILVIHSLWNPITLFDYFKLYILQAFPTIQMLNGHIKFSS